MSLLSSAWPHLTNGATSCFVGHICLLMPLPWESTATLLPLCLLLFPSSSTSSHSIYSWNGWFNEELSRRGWPPSSACILSLVGVDSGKMQSWFYIIAPLESSGCFVSAPQKLIRRKLSELLLSLFPSSFPSSETTRVKTSVAVIFLLPWELICPMHK